MRVHAHTLVWLRRDLRLEDHAALAAALAGGGPVHVAFVFDTAILAGLPRADRRVEFIRHALGELDAGLRAAGGGLIVRHGDARVELPALAASLGVGAVHACRDVDPAAVARDAAVAAACRLAGADFFLHEDLTLLPPEAVLTQGGTPFAVFTPYKRAWLARFEPLGAAAHPCPLAGRLAPPPATGVPDLASLGFVPTDLAHLGLPLGTSGAQALLDEFAGRIDGYRALRDFPARRGPSYLSTHLRFGTLSVRAVARLAIAHGALAGEAGPETFFSELIWRDFYQMILAQHPRVVGACFQPRFDALVWREDAAALAAWQQGRTGYPLVDAAQRQLLASGYMHNRLRMISASFLCKDLELDWRHGEAWFARHLLDFDLAANNGGWQWAASTGCDAQPWFRIFNPLTQSVRFDPEGRFIRRYVPELAAVPDRHVHAPWLMSAAEQAACGLRLGRDYPGPIVEHAAARLRTLARYRAVSPAASGE